MKTIATTASNILNAFAFTNAGNLREFQQLLDGSTVLQATTASRSPADLPGSPGVATPLLCTSHD